MEPKRSSAPRGDVSATPGIVDPHDEIWEEIPELRRRLLVAAVEEFATRGYHATTTRQIAKRAGVSPAGIYVHYASKGELLAEISRIGHLAVNRSVQPAIAEAEGPTDTIRRLVSAFTTFHARHTTLARVVQYEFGALSHDELIDIRKLRRQFADSIVDTIELGVRAGDFHTDDPESVAVAMLSLGVDVARWYTPRFHLSPDALGEFYAEMVLRMLGVADA